ncbi:hypothetical protein HQQ81_14855 [Microbacteriaceae bacterium VKM Ac-2854]|nr:hypothetical protein [Microbacteriaceae bacterium VKM Ac-2854]
MRNDDRFSPSVLSTPSVLTLPATARSNRRQLVPLSRRLAIRILAELPLAERAWEEGAIDAAHLRILAVQVRRLPLELRPIFDELGTALARELPWAALLPVAANLRRHLHGSRG